jgi:hypothetical protein
MLVSENDIFVIKHSTLRSHRLPRRAVANASYTVTVRDAVSIWTPGVISRGGENVGEEIQ